MTRAWSGRDGGAGAGSKRGLALLHGISGERALCEIPGALLRSLTLRPAQEEHADEWLQDVLDGFGEDDYVVFDCPGQARQQHRRNFSLLSARKS